MRILVAGEFEAGSQKAHAINTIKMAQGFKRLGHEVAIACFCPKDVDTTTEKLAQIYGLNSFLQWIQIPRRIWGVPLNRRWGFAIAALPAIAKWKPDLIYARGYTTPFLTSLVGLLTVAEKHTGVGQTSWPFRFLIRATHHRCFALWVTISHRLVDYYVQKGAAKDKFIVLPDAVDFELFERPQTPLVQNPYQSGVINLAYTGHLYDYKGIPTLLDAAKDMPDAHFHLIGGLPEDIARHQETAQKMALKNVFFHGLKPQTEVPTFLWYADYLLLPPSQKHPSAAWTSPVKLAEYMASGTPVIASDIKALRDWVTEDEVTFFEPDNAASLVATIQCLNQAEDKKNALRQRAIAKAKTLTYENRASAILAQVESRSTPQVLSNGPAPVAEES